MAVSELPAAEVAPAPAPLPAPPTVTAFAFASGATVNAAEYPSLKDVFAEGFSAQETSGVWTDGAGAVLKVPLAPSAIGKPLQLELGLVPYLHPPQLKKQAVEVRVENAVAATFDVSAAQTIAIPFTATASPAVFELAFPKAVAPNSFKAGDDSRILGVYLTSIAVAEPTAPAVPAAAPKQLPAQPAPAKLAPPAAAAQPAAPAPSQPAAPAPPPQ